MVWKKKKKEESAEELKARLAELEAGKEDTEEEDLPEELKPKQKRKIVQEEEPKGKFTLDDEEMALAVNALAASEEFKVYSQMVIGQKIAEIIDGYNKTIKGKDEEQEDTDEEELPTG